MNYKVLLKSLQAVESALHNIWPPHPLVDFNMVKKMLFKKLFW